MKISKLINKLILAFNYKDYVVFLNKETRYSIEKDKKYNLYIISIENKEKIRERKKIYLEKSEVSKKLKKEKSLEKCISLKEKMKIINERLESLKKEKYEFKNLIEVLHFLSSKYKELIE